MSAIESAPATMPATNAATFAPAATPAARPARSRCRPANSVSPARWARATMPAPAPRTSTRFRIIRDTADLVGTA